MRNLIAIVLTAFLHSGPIRGSLGDRVEVTDENREAAQQLLKEQACRPVWSDVVMPGALDVESSGDSEGDGEDGLTDDEPLKDADSVSLLAERGVAARTIAALEAAELKTVGDVRKSAETLAQVPGVGARSVETIKAAIA